MKLSALEYFLPDSLIANSPISPRDNSKLLVLDRESGSIMHKHFYDLSDILRSTDVLVMNDTKVFPARMYGKRESGGKVEALFIKNTHDNVWEILGKNIPNVGEKIVFSNFCAIVIEKHFGTALVELNVASDALLNILYSEGHTPIPPYIISDLDEEELRERYQTTYAKNNGSIAAPTAGFHFTTELIEKLKTKGVNMEYITLHVGMGTFAPIKENDITKHKMHSEWYSISKDTARRLNEYKKAGKRIVSVGTTTTRVLESACINGELKANSRETDIFIYPPYKFKYVDGLITNFHLPHSTLLALISAFVSSPNTSHNFINFKSTVAGKAYEEAIKQNYRFYSFGDAMMIS